MAYTYAGQFGPEAVIATVSGATVVVPNATVTVYEADGVTKSTLYTDRTKATTAANPTATDSAGNLTFYVTPGQHVVMIVGVGVSKTVTLMVEADPTEVNAGNLSLAPTAQQTVERPIGITGPGDGYVTQFYRYAHYTGGTSGVVNSPLVGIVDVGPDATDFQWGILGIAYNRATNAQNVAGYFQGLRLTATTGETWGAVIQAVDQSGVADPTVALTSLELDIGGNGTDVHLMRHGIGIYAQKDAAGVANVTVGHGILFGGSSGTFTYGIAFGPAAVTATAVAFQGSAGVGIDFAAGGTFSTAVVRYPAASKISLVPDDNYYMLTPTHPGQAQLKYFSGPTNSFGMDLDLGNFYIYTNQVLTQRKTGWTAATGTATRTTFATSTVTLSVLAEHVKALIDDLMGHGMIGT